MGSYGIRCQIEGPGRAFMVGKIFGGQWTDDKLNILGQYLDSYTTALKKFRFRLIYVDAFAGEGLWRPTSEYASEDYGDFQDFHLGSPRIALEVDDKPFDKLIFIETNPKSVGSLIELSKEHPNRDIEIRQGDANNELPLFCKGMGAFDRAVVFLDPFATQVSWDTVEALAKSGKVDCWILFPRSAIARMMPNNNEPTPALVVSHVRNQRDKGGEV